MKMRRRVAVRKAFLAFCVVMLLLSACRGRAKESLPQSSSVVEAPTVGKTEGKIALPTVRTEQQAPRPQRTAVRFALLDVERPLYEGLIKQFEEENPSLRVEIVSMNEVLELGALGNPQVPDDADQRLVSAADVVRIEVTRETVEQGLVRDLGPLVAADPGFDADDYLEGSLERYQWDGGTWAIPTNVNHRLIFFSKDAFDAAGLPYPKPGWTWDEFLEAARAVTVREGDEVVRWGFVCPRSLAYRMVESRAGGLVDYRGEAPTPRFAEEQVIEALRWYADLHLTEGVMPYSAPKEKQGEAPSLSEEEALIDKGLAAMWPDFSVLWWYRKMQGNVGVVPFPVASSATKTTPAWTNSLAMSAGTQQPDAAWRWMTFLAGSSLEGVGQGTQYLPARRSVAETPGGYWSELDPELSDALRYAVDHGYVAGEPVGYDAFTEAYDAVMAEEKTAPVAMDDAVARVQSDTQQRQLQASDATPAPTVVVAASKEPEAAAAEVTISFVPGFGSFNLEPYRRLAERFREENPEIAVDVKTLDITGAGGGAPSLASLAQSADCFQWFPSLKDPKSLQAVLSLNPFLEADETFDLDDYYPQLTKQFTAQGQTWGLPADATPFVIEYNRDLFDAAGVDYPATDWTWEDFLETSIALTHGEGEEKQYGYVAEMYESNDLMLMAQRLGAELIDAEADPPVLTLDDPSVIEALDWYARLHTEYEVKPAFITDISKLVGASAAYLEREGLVNGGRAAMWTSSATTAAIMGPRQNLNIGVAPVPARADGTNRASILATSGYFISAETEQRLACWKWITFLSHEAEAVQGFPARRSLAESEVYREMVGEERAAAYTSAVADAAEPSSLDVLDEEEWLGGALFWVFQAYGKVLEGEMSAEEALAEAQDFAEEYQACLALGGDYSGGAWRACLKKVDPSLPDFILAQAG